MEWRLKRWAIWIGLGDRNTNFFHSYASHRRNNNVIWDLTDLDGNMVSGMEELHGAAKAHFGRLYSDSASCDLITQIRVVRNFPGVVDEDAAANLGKEVTMQEIEDTLKSFAKDKSPGPDGWTVELFLAFFLTLWVRIS